MPVPRSLSRGPKLELVFNVYRKSDLKIENRSDQNQISNGPIIANSDIPSYKKICLFQMHLSNVLLGNFFSNFKHACKSIDIAYFSLADKKHLLSDTTHFMQRKREKTIKNATFIHILRVSAKITT